MNVYFQELYLCRHCITACAICTAGIDFNLPKIPGTQILDIVIPANETSVLIPIEIVDDDIFERAETFRLNVMIPQESAALGLSEGAIPSTRITINNDDSKRLCCKSNTLKINVITIAVLCRSLSRCYTLQWKSCNANWAK